MAKALKADANSRGTMLRMGAYVGGYLEYDTDDETAGAWLPLMPSGNGATKDDNKTLQLGTLRSDIADAEFEPNDWSIRIYNEGYLSLFQVSSLKSDGECVVTLTSDNPKLPNISSGIEWRLIPPSIVPMCILNALSSAEPLTIGVSKGHVYAPGTNEIRTIGIFEEGQKVRLFTDQPEKLFITWAELAASENNYVTWGEFDVSD